MIKTKIQQELKEANSDLFTANKAFKNKDYKWATIIAYSSMFHFARAVYYKNNTQTNSDNLILKFLEKLAKNKEINKKYFVYFKKAFQKICAIEHQGSVSKEIVKNILHFAIEFQEFKKFLE